MLPRLLLLFLLVQLLELLALIKVGRWIGIPETIGLVILAGVFGAWLLRREGLRTLRAIQAEFAAGRLPTDAMIDGLIVLVAGVLLLAPGLITDVFGFVLIFPPIRALVRRLLKARFGAHFTFWQFAGRRDDDFIEGQARPVREPPPSPPPMLDGQ